MADTDKAIEAGVLELAQKLDEMGLMGCFAVKMSLPEYPEDKPRDKAANRKAAKTGRFALKSVFNLAACACVLGAEGLTRAVRPNAKLGDRLHGKFVALRAKQGERALIFLDNANVDIAGEGELVPAVLKSQDGLDYLKDRNLPNLAGFVRRAMEPK